MNLKHLFSKLTGSGIIWPLLFIIITTSAYSALAIIKHNHFMTAAYDLGIFDQVLWLLRNFQVPFSSFKGFLIWGDHVGFYQIPLSVIYWLWNDPRMLLLAQALIVSLGIYPLWQLTIKKTQSKFLALAVSFSYIFFAGLQYAMDYDFHDSAICVTPLLFAFYFAEENNWKGYWISFFATIITKEDMAPVLFLLGVYLLLQKKLKPALSSMVVSAAWYIWIIYFFIPGIIHEPYGYINFGALGNTPLQLIVATIKNPINTLVTFFVPLQKTKILLLAFGSFAFLPLLSPAILMLTLPNLISRFLSDYEGRWVITHHYSVNLTPILALASLFGIVFILKKLKTQNFFSEKTIKYFLGSILILATIAVSFYVKGPITKLRHPSFYEFRANYVDDQNAVNLIPANASVIATSALVPHLTHRKSINVLYETTKLQDLDYDFVLLSYFDDAGRITKEQLLEYVKFFQQSPNYQELYNHNGVFVFKKSRANSVFGQP